MSIWEVKKFCFLTIINLSILVLKNSNYNEKYLQNIYHFIKNIYICYAKMLV